MFWLSIEPLRGSAMICHRNDAIAKRLGRRFRAVLFDLDDTLYDRHAAFARWAESYLHEMCGLTDKASRLEALAQIALLDAGGYGSKKAVLEEVCRLYPSVDETENTGKATALFYEQFFSQLALDAEAVEVLAVLDAAEMPWGVVTNGLARQWRKLEQMGLTERTSCLFVSDTFGSKKPDPAIFLAAAECLKVAPKDILFVGDHPANDILGAQNVGMQTAWLPRGKHWPDDCGHSTPDLTLASLTDLLPLLVEKQLTI